MITSEQIENDYHLLRAKRMDLWTALTLELQCKHAMEDAEAKLLASGLVEGKNAEQRAANLAMMTATERDAWRRASQVTAGAQMRFDQAQMSASEDALLVRLAEVAGLPDEEPEPVKSAMTDQEKELAEMPF